MRSSQLVLAVEQAWFEQPEDELAAIEDAPVEARRSWWWLAVSLGTAAITVVVFYA